MSWTDERVDVLRKLWTEGLSASQIAAELGGVTRNAVIGKIHRLGLSGRNKGTATGAPRRKTATARTNGGTKAKSVNNAKAGSANTASPRPAAELPDIEKPDLLMLDLLQLTEQTCKFPVGDPQEADFGFCGVKVRESDPYCEYHCRLAYQPAAERRQRAASKTGAPKQLSSSSGFNAF
ncbi:GcrA family cell cycle regulator [Salaquimonas pukyongi]|uniref:GcrA family cell cycle regulator n=1 Tax=Salaquimonas pukyongi TaxID=2712698 RepID=UPI00096BC501|nr:GcrA family cell cycle regulator [Salaquimonas pukyongi]